MKLKKRLAASLEKHGVAHYGIDVDHLAKLLAADLNADDKPAHPREDFYPMPGTYRDDDGYVKPLPRPT